MDRIASLQSRGFRLTARVGAGAVLFACGILQAQTPVPVQTPAARPSAPPAARPAPPPARSTAPTSSASTTPHIIRPTATLGPPAPGLPPAGGAAAAGGRSGAPSPAPAAPAAVAAGAAGAGASRLAGVARYRSVAKPDAVMFDAPSERARKLFVAPQGMPVEVISVLRTWVKVRDPLGDLAWISRDDLTDRRTVIATTVAPLRREAQQDAPTWFNVDRGVVLELLEDRPVNGFLKVRYAEGQIGYIQPDQVWGL